MDNGKVTPQELSKSLNLIMLSVVFATICFTIINGPSVTGYLRALGANDLIYSVIMALPVLSGFVQIISSYCLENSGKRKKMFLIGGLFQRIPWLFVGAVAVFFPSSLNSYRIWAVMFFILIASLGGSFINVSFGSWIGSIIPVDIRGNFFSKRIMLGTAFTASAAVLTGLLLDAVPGYTGYAIIFAIASVFGIMDILCFIWVKEPYYEKPAVRLSLKSLVTEPFHDKNYVKFLLFMTAWSFGVNIPVPFFTVFMIEDLKMSFLSITLFQQFASSITTILFIRVWGKVVDRYGNKPVMKVSGLIIALMPLLWFFVTPRTTFIILLVNMIAGISWPCFDMTAMNLSIWLAPEKKRSIYIAWYSIAISVFGIALAYIAGGALMQFTGPVLKDAHLLFVLGQKLSNFHILLFLSLFIRLAAVIFLQNMFTESDSKSTSSIFSDIRKGIKAKIGI